MTDKKITVEEAVRRSHCSRPDREHACAGQVTITAKGFKLDCPLCGKGDEEGPGYVGVPVNRCLEILRAAGVDWDKLSVTTQTAVIEEFLKDACPNCGARIIRRSSFHRCSCGWTWDEYGGWKRKEAEI